MLTMSASVLPPSRPLLHQDSTLTNSSMPTSIEEDDQSLSNAMLSDDSDEEDDTLRSKDDTLVSKSSMSSMSVFMSSLVGLHSEDWSFCLQVDNAKPRDLPPPTTTTTPHQQSTHSSSSDSSVVSVNHRHKNHGISRWDSTPSSSNNNKNSNSKSVELASKQRPRAMRPWRPPASSGSTSNGSTSSGTKKKADAPIPRPIRVDSSRTLNTLNNAKRPQRYDSDRCLQLNREMSLTDLGAAIINNNQNSSSNHNSIMMGQQSMDFKVLLEECTNEEDLSVVRAACEGAGVYLKIPTSKMQASERSLWSSASTMTASIRTTHSLMSHYSKESMRNLQQHHQTNSNNCSGVDHHKCSNTGCTSLDESHRSLFCKSDEECPIRPPRRTRSGEELDLFTSNACERPVRRPVRSTSNRSMLGGETSQQLLAEDVPAIPAERVASDPLLPPLNQFDSSANLSFRLIRSLSEQTMDMTWRDAKNLAKKDTISGASTTTPAIVCCGNRSFLKRTLSDSLLLFTESVSNIDNSNVGAAVVIEEEE